MSKTVIERPAQDITRRARTNFYYSFLFLPRPKREAIEAVYAFCRTVDDIVDEDFENPRRELQKWRSEIAECFNGSPLSPLGQDLKKTVDRFSIPQRYFEELIVGMEMDLERRRYASFAELENYCYHVAGVIGLMCVEIFGYKSESARKYATKLGTALQLVNILRDVKEDATRQRVYMPQEDMARFGYSEEELLNSVYNEKFVALMRHQCERARRYFTEARSALAGEDRPSMTAAEIMGRIYFRLLERIERAAYNVFERRISLSKAEKAAIALKTWLQTR